MVLPVIAGVVRASVVGNIEGGGRWSNTWHFRRADLGEPTDALIALLHVELAAFYVGWCATHNAGLTTYEKADYTPLDGTSGALSLPIGATGSIGSVTLPPEVCEVLTIRTALRGRRARGRIFLPAFNQASTDGSGRILSSVVTGTIAAAVALQAAAALAGWEVGVASYGQSAKLDRTVTPTRRVVTTWPPFFTPATGFTMDNMFDVQRSRKN